MSLPPLSTFRFRVVLDLDRPIPGVANPLCEAAFSGCEGLELTMTPKTIEVGGQNGTQTHLVGRVTSGQVRLRRGMTTGMDLWRWFAEGTRPGSVVTATAHVTVLTAAGEPAVTFELLGCLPTGLRAPALDGRDGTVAIEELTLVHRRLRVLDADGPGLSLSASLVGSGSASVSGTASVGLAGSLTGALSGSMSGSASASLSGSASGSLSGSAGGMFGAGIG